MSVRDYRKFHIVYNLLCLDTDRLCNMLSKTLFLQLPRPACVFLNLHNVLAYLNIHTRNVITIGANYHVLICYRLTYLT